MFGGAPCMQAGSTTFPGSINRAQAAKISDADHPIVVGLDLQILKIVIDRPATVKQGWVSNVA